MSETEHRYALEPYRNMSMKFKCPRCKHKKTLTRYLDNVTKEYLADHVGLCERINTCQYHFTPKMYFAENHITPSLSTFLPNLKSAPKLTSFIDNNILSESLSANKLNCFLNYLKTLFGVDAANVLADKYKIGTSTYWPGANIFWQIDLNGNIRTGKIMLYNEVTGHRVKLPFNHITWLHSTLKLPEFNLKQCLFGLQLLKGDLKPVAIVESEKTAIIASMYLPQFIWLACGGLQNVNGELCKPLAGRKVVLYPDIKAFDKWKVKANELGFEISELLERAASVEDRALGLDIADYLVKYKYRKFW